MFSIWGSFPNTNSRWEECLHLGKCSDYKMKRRWQFHVVSSCFYCLPHPHHSQSCSLWWVCVQPMAWSCLVGVSILPETSVFSLPLAMGSCAMIRICREGRKILFLLGCLCAKVSFRAEWDKNSLHWNAQPEVVVCVSTVLRWYSLKIQNWGAFLHLPVR